MQLRKSWPARLFGLAMIIAGIAGWYYNRHLAVTQGEFYIKLCIFAPLGVFGGLLMMLRPDWAGPMQKDSPRGQKLGVVAVIGLMAVFSGLDLYSLNTAHAPQKLTPLPTFPSDLGTPSR